MTKEKNIKDELDSIGYSVCGEINGYYNKVVCETSDGYKVVLIPHDIISSGKKPRIFHKSNPYAIENIKKYIFKSNYTCELLSNEYINNSSKLLFRCECGSEYSASLDMLKGGKRYCNRCAKSKRYDTLNFVDYNRLVLEECEKRGYILLPNQNITRSNTRFKYICKKHQEYGVQESYPNNFITKYGNGGCTQCCIEKRSLSKRKEEDFFRDITEKAGMIFCGVKYDVGNRTKIVYKCPKHISKGEMQTGISNMKKLNGRCRYCSGQGRTKEDLQKEIDDMNLCVDIVEYTSYSEPIKAKCRICGNEWVTYGVNLTQGHRCQNCSKSKFELSVQKYLDEHGIKYKSQYKFDDCKDKSRLPFDFYLYENNILIEADGEQHYMPINFSGSQDVSLANFDLTRKHDFIKTEYCKSNNIKLIRIPYWEKNNIDKFLSDKI